MDKGGWAIKVMGYEVWLETEPETGMLIVVCPDLPGCITLANSLDEAVLRMEDIIGQRTQERR